MSSGSSYGRLSDIYTYGTGVPVSGTSASFVSQISGDTINKKQSMIDSIMDDWAKLIDTSLMEVARAEGVRLQNDAAQPDAVMGGFSTWNVY